MVADDLQHGGELAGGVEIVQVVAAADALALDKDIGHGAAPSQLGQRVLVL